MNIVQEVRKLESFLNEVPDTNSPEFLTFFSKQPEEIMKFELKLVELDIKANGLAFTSFHIGNEREIYDVRAIDYDRRSKSLGRRDLIAKVDEFFTSQMASFPLYFGSLSKLDVACGTGERTRRYDDYARSLGIQIDSFGIDISNGMISRASGKDIKLAQASMIDIPFRSSSFDFVTLLFNSLGHLSHDEFRILFREIYRVMKHGSIFFLDSHTRQSLDYYINISYPAIEDKERRQRLLSKRLAIKKHLNQQYHVYQVSGTSKLQNNYHFSRDEIFGLGKNAGFTLVQKGCVTEKDLGYRIAGAEMFVYSK